MSKAIETLREHFNQKPVPNSKVLMEERDRVNAMIDAVEAENDKLRELFYEAWGWMQRARYDGSIRADEMDEVGVKAVKMGFPEYELGIKVEK